MTWVLDPDFSWPHHLFINALPADPQDIDDPRVWALIWRASEAAYGIHEEYVRERVDDERDQALQEGVEHAVRTLKDLVNYQLYEEDAADRVKTAVLDVCDKLLDGYL